MHHELKILTEYLLPILKGIKRFEVRKNDRDYKVGDILHLTQFFPSTRDEEAHYGSIDIAVRVTYILSNPEYVKDDYVILGIEPLKETDLIEKLNEFYYEEDDRK